MEGGVPIRIGSAGGNWAVNPGAPRGEGLTFWKFVLYLTAIYAVMQTLFNGLFSVLEPNEYGLVQNYLSGNISFEAQRGGIIFTGPFKGFISFPATQMTLGFAKQNADRDAIHARTGGDHQKKKAGVEQDPDRQESGGGQDVDISCAIQYKFVKERLLDVYLSFGSYEAARQRYLLWAGTAVSNNAQKFTPQDFWQSREMVAEEMLKEINNSLWTQGYVVATKFEILKVNFIESFEASITGVQVAEQKKVINEYEQKVQQVVQGIQVLQSENDATIANISAAADAEGKEICASASQKAFGMKQDMKATKYKQLKNALGFNTKQMSEYFKVKALQGQSATGSGGGKVTVGLPSIGTTGAGFSAGARR